MSDAADNTGTTSEIDAQSALTGILDFMRGICGHLLADFPDVHRWDQTDDVFQQAALKLLKALQDVQPQSRRHLENLAALQVRRTLIELGRKYAARVTMNQQRWTPSRGNAGGNVVENAPAGTESDPQKLIEWVELHVQIDQLSDDDREVFQLIWYRGLHKDDVASLLNIDVRTVQRRWRSAREALADYYGGLPPL